MSLALWHQNVQGNYLIGEDALIDEYYINNVTTAINEIDQEKVNYTHTEESQQAMIDKDTIL